MQMLRAEKSPVDEIPEFQRTPPTAAELNWKQLMKQFDEFIAKNYFQRDPYRSLIPRKTF